MGSKVKLSINLLFLAGLLAPPAASALSPRFPQFVQNVLADRSTYPAELERLRVATPLWNGAIETLNTALYRIGVSANENLWAMGKDGWMFLGNTNASSLDQSTHRVVATEEAVSDFVRVLQLETEYASRRGIPMLFVVAPSSGTIYPDKLPDVAQGYRDRPSTFDLVLAQAKPLGLPLLDVRPSLIAARATADTYSKFNSHWTGYGGWIAWQDIGAALSAMVPGLTLARIGGSPTIGISGGMAEAVNMIGVNVPNNWTTTTFDTPLPDYQIVNADGTTTTESGQVPTGILDFPRTTRNEQATSSKRLLAFCDSQCGSIATYLQASFAEVRHTNHHVRAGMPQFNMAGYIDSYKPDLILYVMTERYFLYPLGDVKYWEDLTAFDTAPESDAGRWPPVQGQPAITFAGDPRLEIAQSMTFPQSTRPGQRYLKLDVISEHPGQVYVSYKVHGEVIQDWYRFGDGLGELVVPIPQDIDGNTVWIIRDVNQAPVTLQSAEIRTVG